jgi:hypothetical protein
MGIGMTKLMKPVFRLSYRDAALLAARNLLPKEISALAPATCANHGAPRRRKLDLRPWGLIASPCFKA